MSNQREYIESFSGMLGPRLVGRVLTRARKLSMSRKDLCEAVGISDGSLCNMMAGRHNVTHSMGDRLMQAVDLSMEELHTGKDRPQYRGAFMPKKFRKKSWLYEKLARAKLKKAIEMAPPPVYGRMT